ALARRRGSRRPLSLALAGSAGRAPHRGPFGRVRHLAPARPHALGLSRSRLRDRCRLREPVMSEPNHFPEVRYADDQVPSGLILRILGAMVAISITLCIVAYLLLSLRESQLRPHHRFPEEQLGAPRPIALVRAALFETAQPRP